MLLSDRGFFGSADGGKCESIRLRSAKLGFGGCFAHQEAQNRFQSVMIFVVEQIGLSGGEKNFVDTPSEERGGKRIGAKPERAHHINKCGAQIIYRGFACIQCTHHINQNDLAIEPCEVAKEKWLHHMCYIRVVSPLHEGTQTSGGELLIGCNGQGREGQQRRALKITRHEKATRRKAG